MGMLEKLAVVAAPYVLGLFVGFVVAVLALQRWLVASSSSPTGDILGLLRRVGVQYLAVGVALTVLGGNQLAIFLTGAPDWTLVQHSLWGLPLGLFFGGRWVLRRGER